MTFILKVHGPNLCGPFDTTYDSYLLDDPAEQTEIEDGYLFVTLPPREATPADGRRPARRATGTMRISYPPGQWSKTVCFEKGEHADAAQD